MGVCAVIRFPGPIQPLPRVTCAHARTHTPLSTCGSYPFCAGNTNENTYTCRQNSTLASSRDSWLRVWRGGREWLDLGYSIPPRSRTSASPAPWPLALVSRCPQNEASPRGQQDAVFGKGIAVPPDSPSLTPRGQRPGPLPRLAPAGCARLHLP